VRLRLEAPGREKERRWEEECSREDERLKHETWAAKKKGVNMKTATYLMRIVEGLMIA
jgi:hypothetical protein